MVNYRFVSQKRSGKRNPERELQAIPNKSLTIKQMVERFIRHLPVHVEQKEPLYVDQTEFDLEKVARMDFAEKAELAQQLKARADQQQADLKANDERLRKEQLERRKAEIAELKKELAEDPLDNTLPVDTNLTKK